MTERERQTIDSLRGRTMGGWALQAREYSNGRFSLCASRQGKLLDLTVNLFGETLGEGEFFVLTERVRASSGLYDQLASSGVAIPTKRSVDIGGRKRYAEVWRLILVN